MEADYRPSRSLLLSLPLHRSISFFTLLGSTICSTVNCRWVTWTRALSIGVAGQSERRTKNREEEGPGTGSRSRLGFELRSFGFVYLPRGRAARKKPIPLPSTVPAPSRQPDDLRVSQMCGLGAGACPQRTLGYAICQLPPALAHEVRKHQTPRGRTPPQHHDRCRHVQQSPVRRCIHSGVPILLRHES